MNARSDTAGAALSRWIVRGLVAAAAGYLLWRLRAIVFTVLLAAVVAAALEPLVSWICHFRIRAIHPKTERLLASILVFVAVACVCVGAVSWLARPFGHEFGRLADYVACGKKALNDFAADLQKAYAGLPRFVQDLLNQQDPAALGKWLARVTAEASAQAKLFITHAWELLVVPVLAFYFVLDSVSLKKYFVSFFPPARRREVMNIVRDTSQVFRSYIVGQIILCVIAGVFMGILLSWLHVKYALTLAVFAGVTRAIPIVGPIFSGVAIVLVIMASNVTLAVKVLAVFTVMHFVESKLIMPALIGERMRLHPAVLLICILAAYEFFGVFGMFLAAPVAAMARSLIRRYYLQRLNGVRPGPGKPRPAQESAEDGAGTDPDVSSSAVA